MRRPKKASGGCPEWMVTYGDMTGLLLCFFIMLASMSELRQDKKFQQVAAAVKQAFGMKITPFTDAADFTPVEALINQLRQMTPNAEAPSEEKSEGETNAEGVRGRNYRVTDVREGIHIEIGGRIAFARGSAELMPPAAELVREVADRIRGRNNVVKVTGHATRDPLPPDSPYRDVFDLSFARARAVADELARAGVRPERMRIIAAGSAAPLERDDYSEDLRTRNRRVEIVVTEALAEEYTGEPFRGEFREFPDAFRRQ
jgi:chemotaxis protein MotB